MKYQPKINPAVEAAVKALLNETNAMGSDRQADVAFTICETVKGDHRTLQQAFWSVLLKAQILYANAHHDGRNEDAIKLARGVKNADARWNLQNQSDVQITQGIKDVATELNFDLGLRFI